MVIAAALLLAAGLSASTWLGGPGWGDVGDAVGTISGEMGGAVPAGPASDSAAPSGTAPDTSAAGDSTAAAATDTADPGG